MKNYLFPILVLMTLLNTSCKNTSEDPKSVLSQFFDAMAKKDIVAARNLSTEESKSMLDMMEMQLKLDSSSNNSTKYDKSQMEFGEPKIDGDKATVLVKPLNGGESLNFSLKKEKGHWKVAFDKSSMINMGMEKMQEKGINAVDSLGKAVDGIQNMSLDSMKKGLSGTLKKLDSIKKLLKKEEIK